MTCRLKIAVGVIGGFILPAVVGKLKRWRADRYSIVLLLVQGA